MTYADNLPLFVYGTLLTVARHPMGNLLREHGEYTGCGSIRARLYIINDPDEPDQNFYPGAVPSGNIGDRVHGELYSLRAPELVLEQFDDYEACSARWPPAIGLECSAGVPRAARRSPTMRRRLPGACYYTKG